MTESVFWSSEAAKLIFDALTWARSKMRVCTPLQSTSGRRHGAEPDVHASRERSNGGPQ